MARLRTKEAEEQYKKLIASGYLNGGCKLCEAPALREFSHWKIVENKFPYDRIARVHDMVLPKRHVEEDELSQEEKDEYRTIKEDYIEQTYEYLIEATSKQKSIPEHFHLHLIIPKEN